MAPRTEHWVPKAAVAAVAVAAVTTVVMVKREEMAASVVRPAPAVTQAALQASAPRAPVNDTPPVVQAPPLKPPPAKVAQARPAAAKPPAAQALGGPALCRTCGVVESVVALKEGDDEPARGYQMHIRMDDGSVRTVEQRGALAAGSRVTVESGQVKALAVPS